MKSLLHLPVHMAAFLAFFVMPSAAFAQSTNQGGDPITSALLFMQSILLGPIATALAVMAVAGVGFMMLTGRMNWRYGATVIIGVFIIFGAPRLVATIAGGAGV
ncbi:TrbC/VirB2 family protein [uncultured Erythrobacter sp.]|uniref:TrbC/VirB2 family protein n=1 Tax=uncultured Erythrobacter sp. TaxID=263913 RepID=UPI00260A0CA7|nr:TrbC/VirB2 family protein [uncultured Erythrobacter sp.]